MAQNQPMSHPPAHPRQASRHQLRYRRMKWIAFILISLPLLALIALLLASESYSSRWQSELFSRLASGMHHQLEAGASPQMVWPVHGPFDQRFGYVSLPDFIDRLQMSGYSITEQARQSSTWQRFARAGFYPPYRERTQAGLEVSDCRNTSLFSFRQPQRRFASFDSIPPILIRGLLFIENRDLLDSKRPYLNPAVNWSRFALAAWTQLARQLDADTDNAGGSTLATQIEKFRHSPDGRTTGAVEKFRQMISASMRAYARGRVTLPVRQNLVLDYLNNVPLAASGSYGEIHGVADALWVWFAADFEQVSQALNGDAGFDLNAQGLALRQSLALLIAQRRPSWYLLTGRSELETLVDSHLRVLGTAGIITPNLRDAALGQRLQFRDPQSNPAVRPHAPDKAVTVVRNRLVRQLKQPLYAIDRLDLAVHATLHGPLQQEVSNYLSGLADPANATQAGLIGERLLTARQAAQVNYSFTLFERTPTGNLVRIQTDTTNRPFDINEDSKMELGSTAKLRVMSTYLEIMSELYRQYVDSSAAQRTAVLAASPDNLTRWLLGYLQEQPQASLEQTLAAAVERRYSASPGEAFATGGGLLTFGNFRREDNGRRPTLRESLRESINLPFVRLLRDIVQYNIQKADAGRLHQLRDDRDPRRLEYLRRFADQEGSEFLNRFWRKYGNLSTTELLDNLLDGIDPTPVRLAAAYRVLYPQAGQSAFNAFMAQRLNGNMPSPAQLDSLYQQYAPGQYSLADLGYIARIHPLELWLASYRLANPQAGLKDALAASQAERLATYEWLFKTQHRQARDSRIRSLLEVEAFSDIHQRWVRLGYPFGQLIPSLATALGSSGDRPAALAELMGIILNDGRRLPTIRIDSYHFARDTPYETRLLQQGSRGEQVMEPAVARTLRSLISDVVERGTARRLYGSYHDARGEPLVMGGKTGTGDNRSETVRGGRVVDSQVRNRTATFVFFLGPRHFGTLTAWVNGEEARSFRFTSALPVQVLKSMAPLLQDHLLNLQACTAESQ